jgi:hypothetical protein
MKPTTATHPLCAQWTLLSIPLTPYPPLLLTAKQSQKQWDRHVRVEGRPTAKGLSALPYARSSIMFLFIPSSSVM